MIQKAIQLVLVEIIVIAVVVPAEMFKDGKMDVVVWLAISILVVYILTHLMEWFLNCAVAKQMTEELLTFQRNHE